MVNTRARFKVVLKVVLLGTLSLVGLVLFAREAFGGCFSYCASKTNPVGTVYQECGDPGAACPGFCLVTTVRTEIFVCKSTINFCCGCESTTHWTYADGDKYACSNTGRFGSCACDYSTYLGRFSRVRVTVPWCTAYTCCATERPCQTGTVEPGKEVIE